MKRGFPPASRAPCAMQNASQFSGQERSNSAKSEKRETCSKLSLCKNLLLSNQSKRGWAFLKLDNLRSMNAMREQLMFNQ